MLQSREGLYILFDVSNPTNEDIVEFILVMEQFLVQKIIPPFNFKI